VRACEISRRRERGRVLPEKKKAPIVRRSRTRQVISRCLARVTGQNRIGLENLEIADLENQKVRVGAGGVSAVEVPHSEREQKAQSSCNGDPLVDGRGGLGRMRGSMDVVDAEWLQGNEVAIVGLKRECIIFGIDEHYSIS
jgi:hypothetical protein